MKTPNPKPLLTSDLPHIAWLGESDFEFRGKDGVWAVWSEKANKGVDYRGLINPIILNQLQLILRNAAASKQREHVALLKFFAHQATEPTKASE